MRVAKKRVNFGSCSINKHELVVIILGRSKQHQHTFKIDMRTQLSLSLHFYLLYLLINSCDGHDAKQRVFVGRLLVALKRASFDLAYVQSDVFSSLTNSFIHDVL